MYMHTCTRTHMCMNIYMHATTRKYIILKELCEVERVLCGVNLPSMVIIATHTNTHSPFVQQGEFTTSATS